MLKAPAHIGARIGEPKTFTRETDETRGFTFELIDTDLAGKSNGIRIVAGLDHCDTQGKPCRDAVRRSKFADDVGHIGGAARFVWLDPKLRGRESHERDGLG